MPIYKIVANQVLSPLQKTEFGQQGLLERDLQLMLEKDIEIISPDTLLIATEFAEWRGTRLRIDLLGIHKSGNIVVIELKRTEDGSHMELQALRYAAMISTLTFEQAGSIYSRYLLKKGKMQNAREALLDFLEMGEEGFAQNVSIVLASASFSEEITTSVLWLNNNYGLDIRCVRMHPYKNGGETLLDIEPVIPVPVAPNYQMRLQEKNQEERIIQNQNRDYTKYEMTLSGSYHASLNKRELMYELISWLLNNGVTYEALNTLDGWEKRWLYCFEGNLEAEAVEEQLRKEGKDAHRYFVGQDKPPFYIKGKTYVLSNQWGKLNVDKVLAMLSGTFASLKLSVTAVSS